MSALLTDEFRQGMESARLDQSADACPYYATSDAADAWHAGRAFHAEARRPNMARATTADIIKVTHGRGYLVNVHCQREDKSRYKAVFAVDYPRNGATMARPVLA
jgi:hypothetical protein